MELYEFKLTGLTPLLIHADDVEASDRLQEWRKSPVNKDLSVPGDDRSPPWTWQTYLYRDDVCLTVPCDNLSVSLRQAGAEKILKKQTTFKSLTQSGLFMVGEHMPLLVNGSPIDADKIAAIEGPFADHAEAVKKYGFRLFVKRATVGQSKHVRVRPRFDEWALTGQIRVVAAAITEEILRELLTIAGFSKGLCDWRPSAKKSPGPYGTFSVELKRVE